MLHLFHGMITFQSQKASGHYPQTAAYNSPNSQGCSDLHQLLNTAVPSSTQETRLFLLIWRARQKLDPYKFLGENSEYILLQSLPHQHSSAISGDSGTKNVKKIPGGIKGR